MVSPDTGVCTLSTRFAVEIRGLLGGDSGHQAVLWPYCRRAATRCGTQRLESRLSYALLRRVADDRLELVQAAANRICNKPFDALTHARTAICARTVLGRLLH